MENVNGSAITPAGPAAAPGRPVPGLSGIVHYPGVGLSYDLDVIPAGAMGKIFDGVYASATLGIPPARPGLALDLVDARRASKHRANSQTAVTSVNRPSA
jgi:hypothetical protein